MDAIVAKSGKGTDTLRQESMTFFPLSSRLDLKWRSVNADNYT